MVQPLNGALRTLLYEVRGANFAFFFLVRTRFDSIAKDHATKTGGLYDVEAGLINFGHRDYDPVVGRWTSRDPLLFNGGDTNFYAYVSNDPVNFVDPQGLWRATIKAAVIALELIFSEGRLRVAAALREKDKIERAISVEARSRSKKGRGGSGVNALEQILDAEKTGYLDEYDLFEWLNA